MTVEELVEKIKTQPANIQFSEIIETVDANYTFTPTVFKNGETMNEANQNNGSCKVFSFAKKQNLSKEETLACFGDYYRKDVLENPEGADHQNIRSFIKFGWDGIVFHGDALSEKN
ncbi:type III effector [Lacihabitans sp. CCS-44]|uniref:HopJ type III effector protein n=1 Tax=Lacihabitans sp. CCS-44 TaxID=2487331 RepID=UPI0020CBC14F|nr:HopJ type III effector protein [Lacihabitans sp. CCS-44]MCP9754041.1 type III effector [Lacihabitans sp. CCS-44]